MLPKNLRLKKSVQITETFKKGESIKGSSLICKFTPNNLNSDLLAVSISKKLKLNAPSRNRIKRQITHAYKEVFLNQLANPENKNDYSKKNNIFIILHSIPFKKPRYQVFREDLIKLLSKLKNV